MSEHAVKVIGGGEKVEGMRREQGEMTEEELDKLEIAAHHVAPCFVPIHQDVIYRLITHARRGLGEQTVRSVSARSEAGETPALPAHTQWRDISTAPKDGTPLLLFGRFVRATAPVRFIGWYLNAYGWINAQFSEGYPQQMVPTHWLPLPLTPTSTEEEDNGR